MTILVVGGDSVGVIKERASAGGHGSIEHWNGRKTRDLARSIPIDTEAVVVVLNRGSHALARKVKTEAMRRGSPIYFQKCGRRVYSGIERSADASEILRPNQSM